MTSLPSSVSALNAFSTKMRVTANNVANVNTNGFKKSRVTLNEGRSGGVEATVTQPESSGFTKQIKKDGQIEEVESSNVDITEEITESMSTRRGHEANLKAIHVQDEMIGTLFDTIA